MLSEGALSSQYAPAVDVQPSIGAVGADAPFRRLHAIVAPLTIGGLTIEDILTAAERRLGDHPAGELARKLLERIDEIEYRTQITLLISKYASAVR